MTENERATRHKARKKKSIDTLNTKQMLTKKKKKKNTFTKHTIIVCAHPDFSTAVRFCSP